MAAADLLSVLIHPWIFLVYDFFQNYQLGQFGCKAEGAIECSILLTSVITLSAISYDRLTAILLPKESRLTKNRAKVVIIVTWITGLLISTPLFFYRTYKVRLLIFNFKTTLIYVQLIKTNKLIYTHFSAIVAIFG